MAEIRPTAFTNATIITYDEARQSLDVLHNASLLVEGGRISHVATGTLPDVTPGTEIIDATDKIISPGFINTHHHMWQSAFRTTACDTTLSEYFAGRHSQTGPAGEHFTPEDIYLGQLACAVEMIDGGTTTVLDHAHAVFTNEHIDAAVDAVFQSGLRVFFAHTVQDIKTTGYKSQMAMMKLFDLAEDPRFSDDRNPVSLGVAYDLWKFVPTKVNEDFMGAVINHNNQRSSVRAPISVLTSHFVAGPFAAYNSPALLDSLPDSALSQPTLTTPKKLPIIFSHASFMSHNDAKLIRAHPHVSISTTPESEAHYGHTSVGAEMCQDCASLGCDTHFTFSSYMPFQARLWLQQLRERHYRHTLADNSEVPMNNPMECEAAFLLMTQKGGEALGRSDLGVIRVGAQADLVFINTKKSAGLWGVRDPVAAVVLHSGGSGDVEGVMVQGKWLKRDHNLVSPLVGLTNGQRGEVTVEDLRRRFQESALRIQKIWEDLEPIVFKEGEESISGAEFGRCKTVDVRRKPLT